MERISVVVLETWDLNSVRTVVLGLRRVEGRRMSLNLFCVNSFWYDDTHG